MSSTQTAQDNNIQPQYPVDDSNNAAGLPPSRQDPTSYVAQPPASLNNLIPPGPCLDVTASDKRFTTAYGMVMWPTLPGMSSGSSGTPTRPVPSPPVPPSSATATHGTNQAFVPGAMAMMEPPVGMGEPVYTTGSTTLLRAACDACHRMKRRCDGKQPCTRCDRRSRDCFYSYKQKSGPPKGSKRKLIEAEDDLPENRSAKPTTCGRLPTAGWSGHNEMAEQGGHQQPPTHIDPVQGGTTAPGPSPEARAAAAAAVAASRMNALGPVPPALAPTGLRPPYMLQSPSGLPGLSGGAVPPAAPLVTHPRYGTVYQHQYPPEVYALYLAELRQRSCNSINGSSSSSGSGSSSSGNNSTNNDTKINGNNASDDSPQRGANVAKVVAEMKPDPAGLGRLWGTRAPYAAEASPAASAGRTAGVAATEDYPSEGLIEVGSSTTETERSSDFADTAEHLAGGRGAENSGERIDEAVVPDRVALAHVASLSEGEGWGGGYGECAPARAAAAAAAASSALAAAVAAAIAESSPRSEREDEEWSKLQAQSRGGIEEHGWSGIDLKGPVSPMRGNRFDAVPDLAMATMMPKFGAAPVAATAATAANAVAASAATVAGEPSNDDISGGASSSRAATQRERQAAAGLLLYGARGQAGVGGEHGRAKEKEECRLRDSSNALAKLQQACSG